MSSNQLTVSSTYAHLLIDVLNTKGITLPKAVTAGLDLTSEPQHKKSISIDDWGRLLDSASPYFPQSSVGLELGQRIQPHHLGVLGYALMASGTVKELVRRYARYQCTLVKGFPIQLSSDTEKSTLIWSFLTSHSIFQSNVCAVTSMLTLLRNGINQPDYMPLHIGFVDNEPENIEDYRKILGNNLTFNNPAISFSIQNKTLDKTLIGADSNLVAVLHSNLEALLQVNQGSNNDPELVIKVRRILLSSFGRSNPNIESVAQELGMSKRTFSRRLVEVNTSFRQQVAKAQLQLSEKYLADGRIPLSEIAQLVGFEDQSSFTRAFKKWTGKTPGTYFGKDIN